MVSNYWDIDIIQNMAKWMLLLVARIRLLLQKSKAYWQLAMEERVE